MFMLTEHCSPGQYRCLNTHKCIPLSKTCDGINDCGENDNTDEKFCGIQAVILF